MTNKKSYENYPFLIPCFSILLSLLIYTIGACLLSSFGLLAVLLYLLFCFWFEYRVLGKSCRYCYYYGKLCGLGKGKLPLLDRSRSDRSEFATYG